MWLWSSRIFNVGYLMRSRYLLSLAVLLTLDQTSWSQQEKLGRLSDGRAYRVDSEGNELVDHIAELELQKKDAEFRIRALERDLKVKERQLATVKNSPRREEPQFFEDPQGTSASCTPVERELRVVKAAFEKSKRDREGLRAKLATFEGNEISLQKEKIALKDTLNEASKESSEIRGELSATEARLSKAKGQFSRVSDELKECKSSSTSYRAKFNRVESALERARLDLRSSMAQYKEAKALHQDCNAKLQTTNEAKAQTVQMEEELLARDSRIRILEKRLKLAENTVEEAKLSRAKLTKRLAEAETQLEREKRTEVVRARYQPPAPVKMRKDPYFDQYKAQAAKYIRDIDRGKGIRSQLFSDYNSKQQKSVSFRLSDLRTNSGYEYSSVKSNVSRARSSRELKVAVEQLKAIHRRLLDDIGLLKRLR